MLLSDAPEAEEYGIAFSEPHVDAFLLPESGTLVKDWASIRLELRDGGRSDYLSSDLGGRLCSSRLRDVIENCKMESDELQWLAVDVKNKGEQEKFFFLHFPQNIDFVDYNKSITVGDMIVKPVLKSSIISSHSLLTLPGEAGRTLFVSSRLKSRIEQLGLTGMSFSTALTS